MGSSNATAGAKTRVRIQTVLLVLLVGLLLLGPFLWIQMFDSAPPPAPPAASGPASAAAPPATPPIPAPAATPVAVPVRMPRASDDGADASAAPPVAPAGVRLHVVLRGAKSRPDAECLVHVELVPQGENDPAPKQRRRGAPQSIDARVGAADEFDVDVTPLLGARSGAAELEVTIDREGFLPVTVRRAVRGPELGQGRVGVLRLEVSLVRAGEAYGIVQDDRNRPVKGAHVGSFVLLPESLVPLDETTTDASGAFRLRLRDEEPHVVIAAVRDRVPASAQVRGVAGARSQVTGLKLFEGPRLTGRVRLRGDGKQIPAADVRVIAFPLDARPVLRLGDDSFDWREGRLVRCPSDAAVDESGAFRMTGLSPEDYVVTLDMRGMAADMAREMATRATPPQDGVDFTFDFDWSAVEVRREGRPFAGANVSVVRTRKTPESADDTQVAELETSRQGLALFALPRGASFAVLVAADGYQPVRQVERAPFRATIDLVKIEVTALRLALVAIPGEDGRTALPQRVELRFFDEDRPAPVPVDVRLVTIDEAACVVRDAPSGRFRIEIRPKPEEDFLPAEIHVVMHSGLQTEARVNVLRGGRLEVAARSTDGKPVAAAVQVTSPFGVQFADGTTSAAADASFAAVLPAGKYHVALSAPGVARQAQDTEIQVGRTTRVEFGPPTR